MKKRNAGILLGILISVAMVGCGNDKAAETANTSAETEQEGVEEEREEATETWDGDDVAEETEEEEAADSKESDETETSEDETETEEADSDETETADPDGTEEQESETVSETEVPEEVVGILLPSEETDEQWAAEAEAMTAGLLAEGYDGQVRYAAGDGELQEKQIREFMEQEVSALIVTPADIYSLGEVLDEVRDMKIPVFSYDEMAMNTRAINYYITFNMREVGQRIGENIVEKMELEKAREDQLSYNIEFLMGSIDDSHALFFYNGLMEILQPYLEDGTLVCRSQKTSFDETGVLRWSEEAAEADLEQYLEEFYQEESLDIVCTASDSIAASAVRVLSDAGKSPENGDWPMITGAGCELEGVQNIAAGVQAASVFMDRTKLVETCINTVTTYLSGKKPKTSNYEQYDNGRKIISTIFADFEIIDADNYQLLVDNGYYEAEMILPSVTEAAAEPEETKETEESEEPKIIEEPEITEEPEESEELKETEKTEASKESEEPEEDDATTLLKKK